jgi:hypothetical protein
MDATTNTLKAGTVVRAPRFESGESTGIRKGVVIDTFGDSSYLVWFYGVGSARQETRLVMKREVKQVATLEDLSERVLTRIVKGTDRDGISFPIGDRAYRLRSKMRQARGLRG